ncbi:hypothetical protein [Mucilaginibacter paludis]|uniref:Lipoprotein n=1 Tax=Mucilaginibacter paludis DSM 18603 TaxID=714943 RepID=H1Y1Z1_9SPHI|nr:hypothetical protein [Mucilaginibacter paludis]EHQ25694.1 hypothetical protein Mucpa_1536 [Mucilaginibacter paludis DSM 18603]
MKIFLYLAIILFTLASCKKLYTVQVLNTDSRQGISSLATSSNVINFDIQSQVVKTKLVNNTLTLTYNEAITLLLRSDSLQRAWSVRFDEDFNATELRKFDYYAVNKDGSTTTNYRESNLNNLAIKSKTDTLISNISMTKISFTRTLVFTKTYTGGTDATNEYQYLLSAKDTIGFSAYYVFSSGNSAAYSDKTNLTYIAE